MLLPERTWAADSKQRSRFHDRATNNPFTNIAMMIRLVLFLGLLGVACFAGCGGGPKSPYDPMKYAGVVTYDGAPVAAGMEMIFTPAEGRPSGAIVRPEGKFVATYTPQQSGVQKGKSILTFAWSDDGTGTRKPPKEMEPLLKAYGPGTTGFEINVEKPDIEVKLDIPKK